MLCKFNDFLANVLLLFNTNSLGCFIMALVYSISFFKAISSSVLSNQPRCSFDLWRRLTDYGISRLKSTQRGCRGGQRKCRTRPQCQPPQSKFSEDLLRSLDLSSVEECSVNEVEAHLHLEMRLKNISTTCGIPLAPCLLRDVFGTI